MQEITSFYIQISINLILGIIISFVSDWRLTLINLAFLPFLFFTNSVAYNLNKSSEEQDEKNLQGSGAFISEIVNNSKTVFAYNFQNKAVNILDHILSNQTNSANSNLLYNSTLFGMSKFIIFAIFGSLFWGISNFIEGDFIKDPELALNGNEKYMRYTMRAIFTIIFCTLGASLAQELIGDFSSGRKALVELHKILELPIIINVDKEKNVNKRIGKIEFKNVSFSYPNRPDCKILKNVSFIINPGQSVGLIGFSGSGKSTILQLILRFYDVNEGQILIDDIDIKSYDVISLRKNIGYVMQQPTLFNTSIIENIRYGNLQVKDDKLIKVAIKSKISHKLDEKLVKEYLEKENPLNNSKNSNDSIVKSHNSINNEALNVKNEHEKMNDNEFKKDDKIVGIKNDQINHINRNEQNEENLIDDKNNLSSDSNDVNDEITISNHFSNCSGGEKQRIAISRIILKNPDIILLDEATSALDVETEHEITNLINEEFFNKTKLIIAHRLSVLKDCDLILVMEDGELKQQGTHEELCQIKNGIYYKLKRLQENTNFNGSDKSIFTKVSLH